MADIYADPAATGTNTGEDWTNAYSTQANLQAGSAGADTGIDGLVAGETLHITGTWTLAAPIDIDQASGSVGNRIRFLGYNSSHVVDGTKAVFDGNSTAANCILVATRDYWHWENLEFKNATADGFTTSGNSFYHRFINCDFHDCGGDGMGNSGGRDPRISQAILCRFYNNVNGGAFLVGDFVLCQAYNNTGNGLTSESGGVFLYCVAYNNGSENLLDYSWGMTVGCVSDDAGAANGCLKARGQGHLALGNRFTGTGIGILGDDTAEVLDLYNFINTTVKTSQIVVDQQIRGANTRIETGVEGYIDAAGGNYGLTNSATSRRTAVEL